MKHIGRISLAAFFVIANLVGCSTLHEKQGEWIFRPAQGSWGATSTFAERLQEDWIQFDSEVTGRKTRLHLVIDRPSGKETNMSTKPVMLYLHGARWNVSGSVFRIQRMRELGFTVVAVDYRGFGKSDQETPSEAKAYEDAAQAWQYLRKQFPNAPRFIFGHSLGGAIAVDLAHKVNDEVGTIVEGTFTSIPDVVGTTQWGWVPLKWLITQRFNVQHKIAKIGSPLIVVHGTNDRVIPIQLGQALYEAAHSPKRWVAVDGGSHHNTNSVGQSQYRTVLKELFPKWF